MDFQMKEKYGINDLLEIMKILRSENGCPWDKEQTHESIRTDLIEETYEVCEGIDSGDADILREELGDLLMQVVFHAEIENERGTFDFADVCDGICKKLIYRHPHVFGDVKVSDTDEVLKNWDALKKKSKQQDSYAETLESVPRTFPALLRGEKVCKRASRAGLEINDAKECADAVRLLLDKLENNSISENNTQNSQIAGDLLLLFCNLARIFDIDCEKALTFSTNRFIMLFGELEKEAVSNGSAKIELTGKELYREIIQGNRR